MILYHGTSAKAAEKALKEGLKPRGRRKSQWEIASHENSVYLTDAYAPYFSFNATKGKEHEMAVIAVDTSRLSIANLAPDEDALEQVTRGKDDIDLPMGERTQYYRDNQLIYAHMGYDWRWSLKALGTCCHHGTIPPSAIVKVVTWSIRDVPEMHFIFDPTISLMNYSIMSGKYRYLMQEMMGFDTGHQLSEFDRFTLSDDSMSRLRGTFSKMRVAYTEK